MQFFFPTLAAQLEPIDAVLGTIITVLVSFTLITLTASYYRFQRIIELAEHTHPEEMGAAEEDILRIQLARYVSRCSRQSYGFSLTLIRVEDSDIVVRMDSDFVSGVRREARADDTICIYDNKTIALLQEIEPADAEKVSARMLGELEQKGLRVGMAFYPDHALSGMGLLKEACTALSQTSVDKSVVVAEIVDELEVAGEHQSKKGEDAEEQEESSGRGIALDALTGVLKPSAISPYMQRALNDFRRKRKPASLFSIGVNNLDHVVRVHGEDVVDDILVGVSGILQGNLRKTDVIGRHEKHAFVALVQCSLEQAEQIGRRISFKIQQTSFQSGNIKLKSSVTLGVASFPEHGHNLHQLYVASQRVLDYSRANDIRAYAVYDPKIHDKVPSKPMRSIKSVKA